MARASLPEELLLDFGPERDPVNYFKAFEMMDNDDKMAVAIAYCNAVITSLNAQATAMKEIVNICSKYASQTDK